MVSVQTLLEPRQRATVLKVWTGLTSILWYAYDIIVVVIIIGPNSRVGCCFCFSFCLCLRRINLITTFMNTHGEKENSLGSSFHIV